MVLFLSSYLFTMDHGSIFIEGNLTLTLHNFFDPKGKNRLRNGPVFENIRGPFTKLLFVLTQTFKRPVGEHFRRPYEFHWG